MSRGGQGLPFSGTGSRPCSVIGAVAGNARREHRRRDDFVVRNRLWASLA